MQWFGDDDDDDVVDVDVDVDGIMVPESRLSIYGDICGMMMFDLWFGDIYDE